jgi:hypothetical protein
MKTIPAAQSGLFRASIEGRAWCCQIDHGWLNGTPNRALLFGQELPTPMSSTHGADADAVADYWSKISDFAGAKHFTMGGEQTQKLIERLQDKPIKA